MSTAVAGKGLEGIVAANSGICWIDGEAGILSYRGIDIHELAEHSTFEEMHVPAVERNPAECAGVARVPGATGAGAVAGSARDRHAAQLSHVGHADGSAADDGFGAELL